MTSWWGYSAARDWRPSSAVLLGTVAVCSGLIGWHEFRENPAEETTYGQGTAKAAFYATIFWIALFLCFYFVPMAYFGA